MRVVRYYAPEDVRLEDIPEPMPGPKEVKLRVRANSICGTDAKIFHHGHHRLDPPRVLGHELAGEVVEVGARGHRRLGRRRPGPGHRCRAVRGVRVLPARLADRLPDAEGRRVPLGRWARAVHHHPRGGPQGRRPEPDRGARLLRRGLGRRAVRLCPERPGAGQRRRRATSSWSWVLGRSAASTCAWPARGGLARSSSSSCPGNAWTCPPSGWSRIAAICSAEVDPVAEVLRLTEGRGADVIITAAGSGQGPGGCPADGCPARPDQPVRRAAEGQADHHLRLERRALPRAARWWAPTAPARRRTDGPWSTSPRERCRSRT